MAGENSEIAKRAYRAYVDKDRAVQEALIAEDFHFSSPLDNRIDRAAYFDRCWPNSETIDDFSFVRVVEEGDQVVVTYEGTSTQGTMFRNTECLTIRNGQIIEVEVYFGWSVPHPAPPGGYVDT